MKNHRSQIDRRLETPEIARSLAVGEGRQTLRTEADRITLDRFRPLPGILRPLVGAGLLPL